jgi:hypothetical protein
LRRHYILSRQFAQSDPVCYPICIRLLLGRAPLDNGTAEPVHNVLYGIGFKNKPRGLTPVKRAPRFLIWRAMPK